MRQPLSAIVAVFLFAAFASAEAYKEIEVKDGGVIKGQVTWQGDVPKEAATEVPVGLPQQAACHCKKVDVQRLRINPEDKGVAGAVVYIARIEAGKKLPAAGTDLTTGKDAVLDQIGCRYVPDLLVVPVKTQLTVTSSDNTSHNVNARMGVEQRFNLLIPQKGVKEHGDRTSVGTKPGVITLSCNAGHPWMSGYIHVVDQPYYAVTDKNGRFELKDVPPGKYEVVCWHPSWLPRMLRDAAGMVTEVQYPKPVELKSAVTVEAGKPATLDFKLSADAAKPKAK